MKNIYLIGYRATGKSTVSNIIKEKLGKEVIHMDDELIKKIGEIGKFVSINGWDAFRDEESKLLKEISKKNNIIIDCGGGIIVRDKNIELIKKTGICFWLKASASTIAKRLKSDKKIIRPSLTQTKSTIDEIKEVLNKRIPLYEKTSNYQIDTENKSIGKITDEIMELLK
ncbi:shikimate kinase [archaeon]|jgi:shikimate kinase|nr:shikimate kinase [archaeon]MBT4646878.1 shikimate kinase [archaeon]MBT6822123.1 shikimate kinase [archaeon]MBT7392612.1 shikimate kinase [archaeon]